MSERPDEYAPIADVYDAWCLEVTEDIPFYLGVTEGVQTPIVEIGAGTGRITLALAAAGRNVIAVDRSTSMLNQLAKKAVEAQLTDLIEVRSADLLELKLTGKFERVLIPFRTLLHLRNDVERLQALGIARGLLKRKGLLAFDVFTPTPTDIKATQRVWYHRDSGARERADWNRSDGTTKIEVQMRGRETTLTLHPIPTPSWIELVQMAGFEIVSTAGDFEGAPVRRDGTGDLVVIASNGV